MTQEMTSCPAREFAEYLIQQGEKLERRLGRVEETAVVDLPWDTRRKLLLIGSAAPREFTVTPYYQCQVETLPDLAALAAAAQRGAMSGIAGGQAQIWYDHTHVTLFPDGADARHVVQLQLAERRAWDALHQLLGSGLSQQEMLELLRGPLKGCIYAAPPAVEVLDGESAPAPVDLVTPFRGLNFSKAQSVELQQQRETFGRDVEVQVTGTGALPEEILIRTPVYRQVEFVASVRLALVVRLEEQKFRWCPVGDDLAAAWWGALAAVRRLLGVLLAEAGAESVPVYQGQMRQAIETR